MNQLNQIAVSLAKSAKEAAGVLYKTTTQQRNLFLSYLLDEIDKARSQIIQANKEDISYAQSTNLSSALIDRLTLNDKRIDSMLSSIKDVLEAPDHVGEIISMWRAKSGMLVGKMRVPLGVICIIYEARPNVTVDAAALCIKSANALILRGGKEAINTNKKLVLIIQAALKRAQLPENSIVFVDILQHQIIHELAQLKQYIDVMILRGGKSLIEAVGERAKVPIIEHGEGNCHVFVDESAQMAMAEEIVYNAKVQRPGVCNAMETLLVHKNIAAKFLPAICERLSAAGVVLRGCDKTRQLVKTVDSATESDWYTEYLDLILAIKVVNSIDEAIEHIQKYGSHHSDAIITNSYENAQRFINEVDSAAVYVNASTRFTDGYEFGLGSELGISTQKLHVRGPMSLIDLTTTKFIIFGSGQIRH